MAQCSGSHITEMQLFHELKQRFPNIPDRVVTHCIKQTRGNKAACTCILEAETLLSSYRMSGRPSSLNLERSEGSCLEIGDVSYSAPATPSIARRLSCGQSSSPPPSPDLEKPRRPPTVRSTSMPDVKPISRVTQLLIQDQLARKKKLEIELEKDKQRVREMQKVAETLQAKLNSQSFCAKIEKLRNEIESLRTECNRLTNEVDHNSENGVPLGETSEEFYRNIYTGQAYRQNHSRHHRESWRLDAPEGGHWCCHMCTFRNHPLLDKCEECDMPRIVLGTFSLPPHPQPPPITNA